MNTTTTTVFVIVRICQYTMIAWLLMQVFWGYRYVRLVAEFIGKRKWLAIPFHTLAAIGLVLVVLDCLGLKTF